MQNKDFYLLKVGDLEFIHDYGQFNSVLTFRNVEYSSSVQGRDETVPKNLLLCGLDDLLSW